MSSAAAATGVAISSSIASLATSLSGWQSTCAMNIASAVASPTPTASISIVGENGLVIQNFGPAEWSSAWGVTYDTCAAYCGSSEIPSPDFNFGTFQTVFTSYLLPWLQLVAQLPYETDGPWKNIMSLCMAIGSPALITYSLSLTILNRYWVRRHFDRIYAKMGESGEEGSTRIPREQVQAIQYLLQEAQQVPIRITNMDKLKDLVSNPENKDWWLGLRKNLSKTRRGVTFSLVAQMLLASVAYLLTIIGGFQASAGDPTTALEIAAGNLWVWMLPIITGWILVGTQASYKSIDDALKEKYPGREDEQHKNKPEPDDESKPESHDILNEYVIIADPESHHHLLFNILKYYNLIPPQRHHRHRHEHDQKSLFECMCFFRKRPKKREVKDQENYSQNIDPKKIDPEKPLVPRHGLDVSGDERSHGPIYNYARVFTWWQFTRTIYDILRLPPLEESKNNGSRKKENEDEKPNDSQELHEETIDEHQPPGNDETRNYHDASKGTNDSKNVPTYTTSISSGEGAHNSGEPPENYHLHYEIKDLGSVWLRIAIASFMAIFIQWGTTGSSIMIAYLTPAPGLGCHSGGFLFYGLLGTVSWLLFLLSMLLSHEAMLKMELDWLNSQKSSSSSEEQTASGHPGPPSASEFRLFGSLSSLKIRMPQRNQHDGKRKPPQPYLQSAAVWTRFIAKLIAVINSIWLLLSSIFESVGAYDNCWCNADYFSKRTNGWILVFQDASELANFARPYWGGAIAFSTMVCLITLIFFWICCRNEDGDND